MKEPPTLKLNVCVKIGLDGSKQYLFSTYRDNSPSSLKRSSFNFNAGYDENYKNVRHVLPCTYEIIELTLTAPTFLSILAQDTFTYCCMIPDIYMVFTSVM